MEEEAAIQIPLRTMLILPVPRHIMTQTVCTMDGPITQNL